MDHSGMHCDMCDEKIKKDEGQGFVGGRLLCGRCLSETTGRSGTSSLFSDSMVLIGVLLFAAGFFIFIGTFNVMSLSLLLMFVGVLLYRYSS